MNSDYYQQPRSSGPGPLPNRWIHCPRRSNQLLLDKFMAFKAPLDNRYDEQVPPEYRFHPSMVFQSAHNLIAGKKVHERPKLGLWIDLSRSKRFYTKESVEEESCIYFKLECHGHEGAPTVEQTRTFIHVCSNYISKNPFNIVGVHCTHGFNRTGFMLAAYLIEEMDFSVEAAIQKFAEVRPDGIYKNDYIQELYDRYEPNPPSIPVATIPKWHELGNDLPVESESSSNERRAGRCRIKENPTFMDDVSGTDPVVDRGELIRIRRKVQELTKMPHDMFVGSQPVSMDRKNMTKLATKEYKVSWKADGTRYMLYVEDENHIYFLDRDNSAFKVRDMRFFSCQRNSEPLRDTLMDGEMVIDVDKADNKRHPRYLVYDIVYLEGEFIGGNPHFSERMSAIQNVISQRQEAMKAGLIMRHKEPFSVRVKEFFGLEMTSKLMSPEFAQKLSHEPDGLIFQPCNEEYIYGPAENVLKWKPQTMNSVDFRLSVNRIEKKGCLPEYIGNLLATNNKIMGQISCNKALRALNNKIIECKVEKNRWVFMRERTDKSFPNSESTAAAVMRSIVEPVTEDILNSFIQNRVLRKGGPLMAPPPSPSPSMMPPPSKKFRPSK